MGLGRLAHTNTGNVPALLDFPSTYYAFLNDDEFYFVVNYSVTRFQHIMFGQSTITNLGAGATGMYISASCPEFLGTPTQTNVGSSISMGVDNTSYNNYNAQQAPIAPAPFWETQQGVFAVDGSSSGADRTLSYVHNALDGTPRWWLDEVRPTISPTLTIGNGYAGNLLSVLPNAWNGESPLLPIRAYRRMAQSKSALVVDLQHARQCRIDNFNDTEIISIGPDQWQVFPFHRKNLAERNVGWLKDHTGTFGWAIRKVD